MVVVLNGDTVSKGVVSGNCGGCGGSSSDR